MFAEYNIFSGEIERITARIEDGVTPLRKRSVSRPITNRINNNVIVYTDGRYLHCRRECTHIYLLTGQSWEFRVISFNRLNGGGKVLCVFLILFFSTVLLRFFLIWIKTLCLFFYTRLGRDIRSSIRLHYEIKYPLY